MSGKIEVVNRKNDGCDDAVYVGRGSPLGNPYSHLPGTKAKFTVKTRDESIERYRDWLKVELQSVGWASRLFMELVQFYMDFGYLKLACWCVPKRCHAEVIADMVREYAGQTLSKPEREGEAVEETAGCQDVKEQDLA